MPTVSILVPAFKEDYLRDALVSATEQTFRDIEILVGDDTSDARLHPVVDSIKDDRIRYFHHGFGNGSTNSLALWKKANGQYVKWLFDDDLLMTSSVETLVLALQAHPEASMAFHERVFIDKANNIVHQPPALLDVGACSLLDRQFLIEHMIARINNFIGEPSNIMHNLAVYNDPTQLLNYAGWQLDYLADVAMYMNCATHGPVVAIGGYLSAFRKHDSQMSNLASSPIGSAGIYEWELILRTELSAGNLTPECASTATQILRTLYGTHSERLSELKPLLNHLDDLTRPDPLNAPGFRANLENARSAVAARRAAAIAQKTQTKKCVVCGTEVNAWIPHPEFPKLKTTYAFVTELETIGSTLEHHNCPKCGCNDRDRHLWLYMSRTGILDDIPSKRILHIAPEARLEPRLTALKPKEYIGGDLFPKKPQHRKINVEALDFPDGYFDLIICNHVLEHVDHPESALAEFNRCLSPQGHLIAQTPYSPVMKHTLETNTPVSTTFKIRYYGQDDHVRLFGADIVDYFKTAGFKGALYPHDKLLGDIDPDLYGVNGKEPFFLFAKDTEANTT